MGLCGLLAGRRFNIKKASSGEGRQLGNPSRAKLCRDNKKLRAEFVIRDLGSDAEHFPPEGLLLQIL
jgi:hypothetical protein